MGAFFISWIVNKEYEIEGRYNCLGPPYHMINDYTIHALQMVIHLYKKYLYDVQLPCNTITYSEYFL